MDTKVLEYLIAVVDEKNISRAADRFYLTQPVLSRHIKNVEQEIGAKLFYRNRGEMLLTDAGRIYINQARAILYTEQRLKQALEDLRQEKRRIIRVMIDPYLLRLFNRSVLPAFEGFETGFDLNLSEGVCPLAAEALHNDLADFAVVKSAPLTDGRLEARVLFPDELVLAAPNAWVGPDTIGLVSKQGPWAFQNRDFLMERSDQVLRQEEQRMMGRYQFKPRMVYEVSGSATILQLVKSEHGVAFLPRALVEAHSQYVTPFSLVPAVGFHVYALWSVRKMLRDAEKELLKLVEQTYCGWGDYMKKIAGDQDVRSWDV